MKNQMKKIIRKNKTSGITLIALVITIIVLLILAGVAIASLSGENGLFKRAQEAKEKTLESQLKEEIEMAIMDIQIETINNGEEITLNKIKEKLPNTLDITVRSNNKGLEGIYKDYFYEIDESYNVTIGKKMQDLYAKVGDIKNLSDFGISCNCAGKAETKYEELYKLGMGSDKGINSNTYTLKIDYDKLISKFNNKIFKGICGSFYQKANTGSVSYTSWAYSEIKVTYKDGTISNITSEKTLASNTTVEEEKTISMFFDDKEISQIEMIIHEYDSDWGQAYGYISFIGLLQ